MPRPLARSVAVAFVLLVLLVVLVVTRWSPLHSLDLDVADGLNRVTAPHPDAVHGWKVVSEVGQPATFQTLAVLTGVVLVVRRQLAIAVFTAGTVLAAGPLYSVAKVLVGRDRPRVPTPVAHATGQSFPSGHAMTSFVAIGVLLTLVVPVAGRRRRIALVAGGALVVALIALSRLALGVHYVSDVAGGWLFGLLWLGVCVALLGRAGRVSVRRRRGRVPPSPGPPP